MERRFSWTRVGMRTGELVVVAALLVAACSPLPLPLPAAENGGPFSTDFTQLLANFTNPDADGAKNKTDSPEAEAVSVTYFLLLGRMIHNHSNWCEMETIYGSCVFFFARKFYCFSGYKVLPPLLLTL